VYGGVKINYLKTMLLLSNPSGKLYATGTEGTAYSWYAGYKFLSFNKLKADVGSRINMLKLASGSSLALEPRMNIVYSLLPTMNVKAAWGIYQQELVTISDEDEVFALFEPWIVTPDYLKVSNSIHYIGGMDYYLTENCTMSLEGYYKVMHNLAVLNDNIVYPTDKQLVNASGQAYGTELTMHYKAGRIDAQLSYGYSWTIKKVGQVEYHPRYDSRNAVKCILNGDLGNDWSASIGWTYNSGMPYTQLLGYYNKYNPLDLLNPSSSLTNYFYYPILAGRNAAHLPDYHRLDMSLSKKVNVWSMNITIDLNIINVYDRENIFYFDDKTGERVNMLPFLPSIDMKVEL
jgi:hypothetical protein